MGAANQLFLGVALLLVGNAMAHAGPQHMQGVTIRVLDSAGQALPGAAVTVTQENAARVPLPTNCEGEVHLGLWEDPIRFEVSFPDCPTVVGQVPLPNTDLGEVVIRYPKEQCLPELSPLDLVRINRDYLEPLSDRALSSPDNARPGITTGALVADGTVLTMTAAESFAPDWMIKIFSGSADAPTARLLLAEGSESAQTTASIPRSVVYALEDVWRRMLRPERILTDGQHGFDGTTYSFAVVDPDGAALTGRVWSPERCNMTHDLVAISQVLRRVSAGEIDAETAESMLLDQIQRLAARIDALDAASQPN